MRRTPFGAVGSAAAVVALAAAPAAGQNGMSGGNATIFVGAYDKSIHVVDEATMQVSEKIPLRTGIPRTLLLSQDRERFYVLDVTFEHVEVVDIARRESIRSFSLSEGNRKVMIWGFDVDPQERFAILLVKTYTKLLDRFEIGEPTLLRYDLAANAVTDTIPWPEDEPREFANIIFSPDGELVYFFADDILILDAATFDEVDRWELAQAVDEGLERFSFGFPSQIYEDDGFYTGLFRITDPVQNRRMMGVARVDLMERDVDFYVLGPSESVSFALAPDRRRAYGLHQEVGNYQFWAFDLAGRRVERKVNFEGRPRMALLPSSNGQLLYIYNAGNTIDVYEAATFRHLRQVELDGDMTAFVLLPDGR